MRFLKPLPLINKLNTFVAALQVLPSFATRSKQDGVAGSQRSTPLPLRLSPPLEHDSSPPAQPHAAGRFYCPAARLEKGCTENTRHSTLSLPLTSTCCGKGGLSPVSPRNTALCPSPGRLAGRQRRWLSPLLPGAGGTAPTRNPQAALTVRFKGVRGTVRGKDLNATTTAAAGPAAGAGRPPAASLRCAASTP